MSKLREYLCADPDRDVLVLLLMEIDDRACPRRCILDYCATVTFLEEVLESLLPAATPAEKNGGAR